VRPRSIAGPIILIGLGILFLINNIRPDFSFWQSLWRYWPFLLIAFGVLRLAEVLVDAGRGKPLPVRSGSGAGIGLIVILCLVFWAVGRNHNSTLHFGNWNSGRLEIFGEQFDYPVSSKGDASGVTLIVLDNLRGNITVTGGDGTEYVAEGRKTIRAYDRKDADLAESRSHLRFVREGNQLVVRGEDGGIPTERRVSTDLDLKVPRGVNLEARGRSGDISVTSLSGTVDVASDRGDVRLSDVGGNSRIVVNRSNLIRAVDIKGNVDVEGHGADVQVENIAGQVTVNGTYSGTLEFKNLAKALHFESSQSDMRIERLPGSLTLDLSDLRANNIVGPTRLKTKSRDIHIEDFTDNMEVDVDRGDVELTTTKTPPGKIDVHSHNGNIELALPEKATFDLKATTNQGEAHNDFGSAVRIEREGRSATLRTVDSHGPSVTLQTNRGEISIRKAGKETEQ
jgi:hypothetical protein